MKKKLIEVALPLIAINRESAREKSIRHGHPSTLHLWWARRPLAAARAILFASLVDDPSSRPDLFPSEDEQNAERDRLFELIETLILWENSNNEGVLSAARKEIKKSCGDSLPEFLDPFAGGGAIPLEAQRLGLRVNASDLNPVAVMINKAMVEIPPKFSGLPPVNPDSLKLGLKGGAWERANGLAKDVEYYAEVLSERVFEKISQLYPTIKVPDQEGSKLDSTVIAWLWARTVKCPNPACGVMTPLVRSFSLSNKGDYIEPYLKNGQVDYNIKIGKSKVEGTVGRLGAKCAICHSPISFSYIREEGQNKSLDASLMAIVSIDNNGRIYLPANKIHAQSAAISKIVPDFDQEIPSQALGFRTVNYGLTNYSDLFSARQSIFLTTLCEELSAIQPEIENDAKEASLTKDKIGLADGGVGAKAYSQAVMVYLSFIIDKMTDRHSNLCSWDSSRENIRNTFTRQTISMIWDYAEGNPFSASTGSFKNMTEWIVKAIKAFPANNEAIVNQADAQTDNLLRNVIISTDPPYYDNIHYANISDYFYIWLRHSLKKIYKSIFSTIKTPKNEELVADHYRFGDKEKAKKHFESGLKQVFANFYQYCSEDFPLTIYYAFKQKDADGPASEAKIASTGWETMLAALIDSGFTITGTWPIKSELGNRANAQEANALASSIVLVCRKRPKDAKPCSHRDFVNHLRKELKVALNDLRRSRIAPVDMAQASIGPGMAIYSRYSKIVETDGSTLPVRTALGIINEELDKYFAELEGSLDIDSWLCYHLFTQFKFGEIQYGDVDVLARAKNTSIEKLVDKKVLFAKKGKVRLYGLDELPKKATPGEDNAWLLTHQLTHALKTVGMDLCAKIVVEADNGDTVARAHSLAYMLYNFCEKKGWAPEAFDYNSLIQSWPEIQQKIGNLQEKAAKGEDRTLFQ
ncbi:MAG: DUF1156 domain-containing protein [Deltaproteobacteria bacterium]|jgi:putative DNA methylase|nr:DUF1156 domain-containing protein [Deltaproteobacteria bacterium]